MSKTLLKITMPSAPSVSITPFDAQTIGLTDWDNDITVGGLTYRATRFALGDATSSQDFSQGKGGFALGNQIDHISLENGLDGGGLLSAYVASGAIPLNGAIAQLLDETGAATVQTWILCEMAVDGATLSFSLRTPGYMSTKLVRFAAAIVDGAVNVGLVVGDSSVNPLSSTRRYKGVSAPTASQNVTKKIDGETLSEWNYGNPAEPDYRQQIRIISASEMVTTTIVPDTAQDEDGLRDFWKTARPAFVFNFETQQQLDAFWNSYIGLDPNNGGWKNLQPNTSLIISDGSNSETLIRRDANGFPILGVHNAPIVGIESDSLASRSVTIRQTVDHMQLGTVQAYKGNPNIYQEWIVINEPLLFAKNYALRSFGGGNYPSFFVAPILGGSLASSDPESVALYISNTFLPICVGATDIVGFNNESAIVVAPGDASISGQVLQFTPTLVDVDGFEAWTDVDISKKIALTAYILGGTDFTALFHGKIISAVGDDSSYFSQKMICGASSGGSGAARYIQYAWRAKITKEDLGFTPSYLFADFSAVLDMIKNSDYTKVKPMIPFVDNNSDYELESTGSYQIYSMGRGAKLPSRKFDSIDALNKSSACQFVIKANSSDAERSAIEMFQNIHIYAISKISLGSNPAVVVPGNFPGTSNPTTTPVLAATQLASWLGLAPKLTGGITPSPGTWGEFIGAAPDEDDTTYGKQRLGDMLEEAWIYGQEANSTAKPPDLEVPEYPVLPPPSVDDLVTEPSWDYDYAGTSKQFTATIKNVGESFDISKGDGYFWGGWQEKDACHFSASPGSAVLAMCQMEDCLAVVGADGYLRCSYDGGTTWPFSLSLYGAASINGVALAGNGIMAAVQGKLNGTSCAYSTDAGRTWATIATFVGATIQGGWFDATSDRFWLCGKDSLGAAAVWYSVDAVTWTKISATGFVSVPSVVASGDNILIAGQDSEGKWWAARNTISGGGSIWADLSISHAGWSVQPFLGRWNGSFRVSVGATLYSSSDLSTWTSVATPAPLQAFATDGAVVSALAAESSGGNRVYYSRDQGATWRAVQISPEGSTWASTGALAAIWDDNGKCFRLSGWGPTRLIALGDPSVLDIWHRCRASCLANSNTIATATYKMPGLYDSFELLRWLLDCKDGTDSEYEQARIDWITKGARFVTLRGRYSSIVDQLSVAAGLPITIPRKILTYSGNAANIPTTGIVSKATHHLSGDDKGLSEIEIIMPPL